MFSRVFDLLIPLFDVLTSRMSNATFSNSTSHSTHTFLPNPTTFLRVAFDLLAILRYFWTTCRILASSMWNPSINLSVVLVRCVWLRIQRENNELSNNKHISSTTQSFILGPLVHRNTLSIRNWVQNIIRVKYLLLTHLTDIQSAQNELPRVIENQWVAVGHTSLEWGSTMCY